MLQFTVCFHSFECFHGLEMGDICIIQLTCSRVNRSGFYCAIKSNAEHASFIYAICQWELLCFLQHTYSLVFCFTDEKGSYSTNSGTLGSQHNPRFRIFAFKCFRKIAKNDRYFVITVLLSVCLSAGINSSLSGWLLVDFDIWFVFENLSRKFKVRWNVTRIMGSLHKQRKFHTKAEEKSKHILRSIIFILAKIVPFMGKCGRSEQVASDYRNVAYTLNAGKLRLQTPTQNM
jgi:hypothetical protein